MLISQSVAEAPQLCSPRSAQSIRERGGRCRTTLIDSSRLFPAIKLSWKINFCILCKLKICHSVPASRFVFCSVYCFRSPPPPHPPAPAPRLYTFACFFVSPTIIQPVNSAVFPRFDSLRICLLFPCLSCTPSDERLTHKIGCGKNAITPQKPIAIKSHRTFTVSIKAERRCQGRSPQHSVSRKRSIN